MPRVCRQLLHLLLALLLAVAPFAHAMPTDGTPGEGAPQGHGAGMHHHATMAGDGQEASGCDDCTAQSLCDEGGCGCPQCGTCGLTLLHRLPPLPTAEGTAQAALEPLLTLSQRPFQLFRPPRA